MGIPYDYYEQRMKPERLVNYRKFKAYIDNLDAPTRSILGYIFTVGGKRAYNPNSKIDHLRAPNTPNIKQDYRMAEYCFMKNALANDASDQYSLFFLYMVVKSDFEQSDNSDYLTVFDKGTYWLGCAYANGDNLAVKDTRDYGIDELNTFWEGVRDAKSGNVKSRYLYYQNGAK